MTKEQIESAPMFAIFPGAPGPAAVLRPMGRNWGLFNCDPCHPTEVIDELVARRMILAGEALSVEPERDDELAPDDYDDLDAAIDAHRAGFTLVKVPDDLGTSYRMMVLDHMHDGRWYRLEPAALAQLLAIEAELRHDTRRSTTA